MAMIIVLYLHNNLSPGHRSYPSLKRKKTVYDSEQV
jgi:hypothetical protein